MNTELSQKYSNLGHISEKPEDFKLYQNFPQSFYKITSIGFDLPESIDVKLAVYDVYGRELNVLANKKFNAGSYELKWDAYKMVPGIYFYKIRAGNYVDSKKMFLLKN